MVLFIYVERGMKVTKIISGVAVVATSVLAVVFMVMKNFNWAVFCITLMFTLTNAVRAKDMASKGYEKESRWMRNLSVFFGVASLAVLFVNLFM